MLAAVILLLYLLIFAPFFLMVAGDAQVHLAVAERFVDGHPFTYNADEIVVASTSPFWTILLVLLMNIAGPAAVLLLKVLVMVIYALVSVALCGAAGRFFHVDELFVKLLLVLWLLCVPVLANAVSGLENILSALQVLLVLLLSERFFDPDRRGVGCSTAMGLVLGWALLTRPDGGALCLLAVALLHLFRLVQLKKWKTEIISMGVCVFFAALVLLPWYAYQYRITGKVFTDSSLARMYAGRRASVMIIPDVLYFHPKALVTLLSFFAPISLGAVIWAASLCRSFFAERADWRAHLHRHLVEYASLVIIAAGLVFYSFVVGADHFGRYFLVIFPLFFVAGICGLNILFTGIRARFGGHAARALIVLAAAYMLMGSGTDFYRRVIKPGSYSGNLIRVMRAEGRRKENTDRMLDYLNWTSAGTARVAVTEVQLRYFVDERITVLSLDGRTSSEILKYMDPRTGMPRFEEYLESVKPDYVQLGQWSRGQNWFHYLTGYEVPANLIGEWEARVKEMNLGDSFMWNGRKVVFVQPSWLKIEWVKNS